MKLLQLQEKDMPMNSMTIIKVLLVHDCNNISETSYILNLIIIFLAQRLKKNQLNSWQLLSKISVKYQLNDFFFNYYIYM